MTNHETIQSIRKKLYLLKDGASSASMREKGLSYKMNWGVPTLSLRELAKAYYPNSELAVELWQQGTRELRIMATMVQDPASFTSAAEWIKDIDTIELAEQSAMNLFSKMPQASDYASTWIQSNEEYIQLTGFLLYTRLFMVGILPDKEKENIYFERLFPALNNTSLSINNRAINSLIHLIEADGSYYNKAIALLDFRSDLQDELKDNIRQAISL